jgi:hypothetical protein
LKEEIKGNIQSKYKMYTKPGVYILENMPPPQKKRAKIKVKSVHEG